MPAMRAIPKTSLEAKAADDSTRFRDLLRMLARRIRSLRERRGLTQEDFAVRCGISVSFASLLERGERSPSYETMVLVSEALDVPLAELFRSALSPAYDDPYYTRLIEFARRRKLTRAQVDRLLALAQIVFEGEVEHPATRAPAKRAHKASHCSIDGCDGPVLAKELCASHYHRARRAKLQSHRTIARF